MMGCKGQRLNRYVMGNPVIGKYISNIALRIVQVRISRDHQLKIQILYFGIDKFVPDISFQYLNL